MYGVQIKGEQVILHERKLRKTSLGFVNGRGLHHEHRTLAVLAGIGLSDEVVDHESQHGLSFHVKERREILRLLFVVAVCDGDDLHSFSLYNSGAVRTMGLGLPPCDQSPPTSLATL